MSDFIVNKAAAEFSFASSHVLLLFSLVSAQDVATFPLWNDVSADSSSGGHLPELYQCQGEFLIKEFWVSGDQLHLLDLVQVVCPPVIDIMEEACGYHGHYLQVSVVPLQHSRLKFVKSGENRRQRKSSKISV